MWHYVSGNYAVADVETTEIKADERPETKFWGFYDGKKYRDFKRTTDFCKYLRQTPEPHHILHHANFDVIQLLKDGAPLKILKSHNGKIIRSKLYEHTFTNTFSCFPVALSKIFAAYGYQKESLSKLRERNYGDCVHGLECFVNLDNDFRNLVNVSPIERGTIAGTGFMAAEKTAGKMPKDLRFLDAYRGGRVEVFDTNETMCSKYDINSSYPTSILLCPPKSELLKLRVKVKDYYCPFFDAGEKDMLLFPNGVFSTWIYRDVLEQYILPNCSNCQIKIVSKHPVNFAWLNELKPLVSRMYEFKQNADSEGKRLAAKFLLNSLYGRMGLRGESERARVSDFPMDGDDILCEYLGKNRWLIFDKIQREPRSNYSYAAYITDNARGRLYQSFIKNGALYGDTDSVFSRTKSNRFLGKLGTDCGEWSVERYKNGTRKGKEKREIFKGRNVKDYDYGGETIRKGGTEFDAWTLKIYAAGKNVRHVIRHRRSGLRKRIVLSDGKTAPKIVEK